MIGVFWTVPVPLAFAQRQNMFKDAGEIRHRIHPECQ